MVHGVAWLLIVLHVGTIGIIGEPLLAIAPPIVSPPIIAQSPALDSTAHFRQSRTLMPTSEMQTIIQTAIRAWTDGQPEAFVSLFADDGEFIVPGDRWVGKEAIRHVTQEFLSTHTVSIDVRHVVIQGQSAAIEWRWHQRHTPTGDTQQADDVIWMELANGKIQRWREYIDDKTPGDL
jgi:uncharacterized protein (TIGR02246 family)